MNTYDEWKREMDRRDARRLQTLAEIETYWLAMHANFIRETISKFEALNPAPEGVVAIEINDRFKSMVRHEAQMHVQRVMSATSTATVANMKITPAQLGRFGLIPGPIDPYTLAIRSGLEPPKLRRQP